MTNHIPPDKLRPQDMVHVFDRGPKESDADHAAWHERHGDGPALLPMHASDAKHAMDVEPERYALEPRSASEFGGESAVEIEPEQTGADGPAWYSDDQPTTGERSESEKGSG